jgi:hypothetical protein
VQPPIRHFLAVSDVDEQDGGQRQQQSRQEAHEPVDDFGQYHQCPRLRAVWLWRDAPLMRAELWRAAGDGAVTRVTQSKQARVIFQLANQRLISEKNILRT